jgi:hypothetical protein
MTVSGRDKTMHAPRFWLSLIALTSSACYADEGQFQKASSAIHALVGDYAARPVCGPLSQDAVTHRAGALQALADVTTPGLQDVFGASPLQYAVIVDDLETMHRFERLGYPLTSHEGTLLFDAARFASEPMVEYLLSRRIDVNATNDYGATALMVAVSEMRPEIVGLLLKRGADPTVKNRDGGTALAYALACGFTESARVLLDGGAPIDEKSREIAERQGISDQLSTYRRP